MRIAKSSFRAVGESNFAVAGVLSVKSALTIETPIGEPANENDLVLDPEGSTNQRFKSLVSQKDGFLASMFAAEKYATRHEHYRHRAWISARGGQVIGPHGRRQLSLRMRISKGLGGAS